MKRSIAVLVVIFAAASALGQEPSQLPVKNPALDSYLSTMRDALEPYGTLTAQNCHNVEIDLHGPWGFYAIPSGTDSQNPKLYRWTIVRVNTLRIFVNLADLNEDKVINDAMFTLDYIRKHEAGTQYAGDAPVVMFSTIELHTMTFHRIDLDKLKNVPVPSVGITEAEMGLSVEEGRLGTILFNDQEHADYFQKALQKAIVVCKAEQ